MSDSVKLFCRRILPQSVPSLLLFVGLLVLVQSRSIVSIDRGILGFVAATRPTSLVDVMNWVFRLGFAQVDLAIAVVWSAWILLSRRSIGDAVPPLLIVVVIAVEVGLRLVVDQPQPGVEYDVSRNAPAHSIASVLDRSDASVRTGFEGAALPIPSSGRGSFPSGHASRTMFLALWAIWSFGQARETPTRVRPLDQSIANLDGNRGEPEASCSSRSWSVLHSRLSSAIVRYFSDITGRATFSPASCLLLRSSRSLGGSSKQWLSAQSSRNRCERSPNQAQNN